MVVVEYLHIHGIQGKGKKHTSNRN
ncbi:uncharacterized protein METZ01_LOCUS82635 [marine metagenome]|uniref:Uncharacterized protein n=1 Tax=marine metagenome TaxID=408172 RepID=A0A381UPS9_9ZZZZ